MATLDRTRQRKTRAFNTGEKTLKTAIATLKSISPYSQSRHHGTPTLPREGNADYDIRTWRERCHFDQSGQVIIPPMAFKNCLSEAAKYLSMQIPGKGKATYTKHIEAGVMCIEPLVLTATRDSLQCEELFVPASGKRGDGKRVIKHFPVIREWGGQVSFTVLDEIVTKEVLMEHLDKAGKFIGIGRFRPRNNGYYGRFSVESLQWS